MLYAMGSRLPVIASQTSVAKAIVEHLKTGILVSSHRDYSGLHHLEGSIPFLPDSTLHLLQSHACMLNLEELKQQFLALIENEKFRLTIGEAGYYSVVNRTSTKARGIILCKLWNSLREERLPAAPKVRLDPARRAQLTLLPEQPFMATNSANMLRLTILGERWVTAGLAKGAGGVKGRSYFFTYSCRNRAVGKRRRYVYTLGG